MKTAKIEIVGGRWSPHRFWAQVNRMDGGYVECRFDRVSDAVAWVNQMLGWQVEWLDVCGALGHGQPWERSEA